MVDILSLTGADLVAILAGADLPTLVLAVLIVAVLAALSVAAVRALRRPEPVAPDPQMLELARLQNETAVRVQALGDILSGRQAELARAVNERLDAVTHRLGQSMHQSSQHTAEHLSRLHERLAVIDTRRRTSPNLPPR
jgi:DNA recombination protein RmuC